MADCGRELGLCIISELDWVCGAFVAVEDGDDDVNHSLGLGVLFDLERAAWKAPARRVGLVFWPFERCAGGEETCLSCLCGVPVFGQPGVLGKS